MGLGRIRIGIRIVAASLCVACAADRAFAEATPIPGTEGIAPLIKQHIQTVIGQEKGAEAKTKAIAQRVSTDGKSETYNVGGRSLKGAAKHPWVDQNGNNPNSAQDYIQDSLDITDDQRFPRQLYSCWEPQLLAKGWWFRSDLRPPPFPKREEIAPGSIDLALACKFSCPDIWSIFTPLDNGYEVIQYWWPEHEVYVNNYGINRLNPQDQATVESTEGMPFGRRELIAAERNVPETQTKQMYSQDYPVQLKQVNKLESIRQDPFMGQEWWGGYASNGLENTDDYMVHGVRTRVAFRTANARPNTQLGWMVHPRMIYDAFPPPTRDKDTINEWTESGMWSVLAHIPQLSTQAGQRGQRAMQALFGNNTAQLEKAAQQKNPFWQQQGAMAYRIQRWPNEYGALRQLYQIRPDNNQTLREVVYKTGGMELFPLTTNMSGFTTPILSSNILIARRGLYMMGTKDLLQFHSGNNKEKRRMNEYTIMNSDKSREIDKMQLIYPRVNGAPSECFRTQIGAANYPDTTQNQWVVQELPKDLITYTKDQFGDVSFIYWNKRVACTCRYWGDRGGAWTMDQPGDGLGEGRGSGDRPYGKIEDKLCTYRETRAPSSFMNDDSRPCTGDPNTKIYKGLQDAV